ncbi:hypothetical protein [Streptomyces sp. NPDC001948]
MAGALWQMAAPGTELRRFYEDTPELAHAVVDVAPRLTDILTAVLRGYSAPARPEPAWRPARHPIGSPLAVTPRCLFRGPARGPLASGPGMTVAPCRS